MSFFDTIRRMLLSLPHRVAAVPSWVGARLYWSFVQLYHLRVEVWSVEGEEQSSGLPLSVLCGLQGATKNYPLQLIFGDRYRERSLGRFWLWNLAKAIPAGSDYSMILTWTCEPYLKHSRSNDWFLIPDWVFGEVDLPRDAKALRKVNGDLRRIRSHGLTYEVTRDLQKFDDFYHNMHVPYISQTFGKCAFVAPYKALKEEFLSSDLILIKSGEQSIAGQLIWHHEEGPFLESVGIRDGNKEHVKNGAACALYHFALQYLEDQGVRKAIVGWSRPFLHDGVLNFKRKWSQVLTCARFWCFGLKVLSPTAAVRAFLRNNPFIFKRRGLMYAAVFVDADQPLLAEDLERLKNDYFHAGLSGLVIYRLPTENAPASNPPIDLPENVEIRDWPL